MNCPAALDLMLEAEPADLAGITDSELSRHIEGCPPCRAAANRILEAERSLRETLAAAAPRRTTAEVLHLTGQRRRRTGRLWQLGSLAAAAGLAGLVLTRHHAIELVPPPPVSPPPSPRIAVAAPHGRSVAVLQTDNPDVVVIWFF
jgi:anti-sigma factor RsiW